MCSHAPAHHDGPKQLGSACYLCSICSHVLVNEAYNAAVAMLAEMTMRIAWPAAALDDIAAPDGFFDDIECMLLLLLLLRACPADAAVPPVSLGCMQIPEGRLCSAHAQGLPELGSRLCPTAGLCNWRTQAHAGAAALTHCETSQADQCATIDHMLPSSALL